MSSPPLWFSLYTKKEYIGKEDAFVDVSNISGIKELEKNYLSILKELEQYLETNSLNAHFNATMVDKASTWKVQGVRSWRKESYRKQKHFPKTMELLNALPGVSTISFNLLEPQATIKPHSGDTNAIIRCHLGLKIPAGLPACGLKVKDEVKAWQSGKVLAFTDAYRHEAWNCCDETRIILLFDMIKPEFKKQTNKICSTIHASFFMQKIGNTFPIIYKVNRKIYKLALFPLVLLFRLKIPIANKRNRLRFT
jgi:aspartyl/asparaginyl beta-hydroxylase (cupin superfamily)